MWKFQCMGFPVGVHWWFWLTMFLLGGGASGAPAQIWVLFVLAAFLSVMVHELGHALAGKKFGAYPSIYLHGFGGVTTLPGAYFSRNQSMWVSFAGPLASMGLALASWMVFPAMESMSQMSQIFVALLFQINVFWTILNLLPIQPLDGGQIFRDFMGPHRRDVVRWVSVIIASLVAFWALRAGQLFLCMMMAYMAFMNYQHTPGEGGVVTR
ncbi:MAG: site-2 protease family protein [Verrucomicrobiota bacterium]|nr:site-2 protease family protein [Verrucomicrobiota bacterium]